jgi:hypothetical protein
MNPHNNSPKLAPKAIHNRHGQCAGKETRRRGRRPQTRRVTAEPLEIRHGLRTKSHRFRLGADTSLKKAKTTFNKKEFEWTLILE